MHIKVENDGGVMIGTQTIANDDLARDIRLRKNQLVYRTCPQARIQGSLQAAGGRAVVVLIGKTYRSVAKPMLPPLEEELGRDKTVARPDDSNICAFAAR